MKNRYALITFDFVIFELIKRNYPKAHIALNT